MSGEARESYPRRRHVFGDVVLWGSLAVAGGLAFLTGGNSSSSAEYKLPVKESRLERTVRAIGSILNKNTVQNIERVRRLDAGTVENLSDQAIFVEGSRIQRLAFHISDATSGGYTPEEVKDTLLSDEASEALEDRNITFEPTNNPCLNAQRGIDESGELVTNFPLSHSEDAAPLEAPAPKVVRIHSGGEVYALVQP